MFLFFYKSLLTFYPSDPGSVHGPLSVWRCGCADMESYEEFALRTMALLRAKEKSEEMDLKTQCSLKDLSAILFYGKPVLPPLVRALKRFKGSTKLRISCFPVSCSYILKINSFFGIDIFFLGHWRVRVWLKKWSSHIKICSLVY